MYVLPGFVDVHEPDVGAQREVAFLLAIGGLFNLIWIAALLVATVE